MEAKEKVLHRAETRGSADHGWLQSRHTFSFAEYHNPSRMNFGALRVLNDDRVAAGQGFAKHPHRDMEIVSVPLAGSLKHEDSEGNRHLIRQGEVQIMSAGTGIYHSEYNASPTDEVALLQIWILPKVRGIKPRYEQKAFAASSRRNTFQILVSPDQREGSLGINQEAFFSLAEIEAGQIASYERKHPGHGIYVFVIRGQVNVAGEDLNQRDALGLTGVDVVTVKSSQASEVLVIEVPMDF